MKKHVAMYLAVSALLIDVANGGGVLTTPANNGIVGVPNNSAPTFSQGLDKNTTTYRIDFEMKLSNTDEFFNIGSTKTFSGSATHNENIKVLYNPGPGIHTGRARLMHRQALTNWASADGNVVRWIGPNIGP